jgi:hypothetical protein
VSHSNEMVGRHWLISLSEYVEEGFLLKKLIVTHFRNSVFIGGEGGPGTRSSRVKSCGEGDELQ